MRQSTGPALPDLLVSGMLIGGLAMVRQGATTLIDHVSSSGLWAAGDRLYRAIRHPTRAEIRIYHRLVYQRSIEIPECADIHDIRLIDGLLTIVSTGTNEILQLDEATGTLTRHQPPGEGDAWHLNSVCSYRGELIFSAFGDFPSHRGWKNQTRGRGCIVSLSTGEILHEGLSMPHSLLALGDDLYLCNSEERELLRLTGTGDIHRWQVDRYPRGLAATATHLFVGESSSRHLDIERRTPDSPLSRIAIFDRGSMTRIGDIPVPFAEIYDLRVVDPSWYGTLTTS